MHGLYRGRPVARRWRQLISDADALRSNDATMLLRAVEQVEKREFVAVT